MKGLLKKITEIKPILIGLGEMDHGVHTEILKQLLNNLDSVNGIFLEYPVGYQNSINEYIKSGILDQNLTQLLAGAESEGKNLKQTLTVILDFAKKKRVPVICIDSSKEKNEMYFSKSKYGSYFLRSGSRDEDMYLNIVENLEKRSGTWIIIAHAAHLDFSFDMHKDDPSLGKRLKEKLANKFFGICLLKDFHIKETQCVLKDVTPNEATTRILENKDYSFLFEDGRVKGFESLVIHQ